MRDTQPAHKATAWKRKDTEREVNKQRPQGRKGCEYIEDVMPIRQLVGNTGGRERIDTRELSIRDVSTYYVTSMGSGDKMVNKKHN